ncbi:hypothetical protein EDB86DRAFT_619263 [Lactarius hatsudake]|nr:hypothetical protein EDB86DRAFT_619263 [Lactarius hatsudake]
MRFPRSACLATPLRRGFARAHYRTSSRLLCTLFRLPPSPRCPCRNPTRPVRESARKRDAHCGACREGVAGSGVDAISRRRLQGTRFRSTRVSAIAGGKGGSPRPRPRGRRLVEIRVTGGETRRGGDKGREERTCNDSATHQFPMSRTKLCLPSPTRASLRQDSKSQLPWPGTGPGQDLQNGFRTVARG